MRVSSSHGKDSSGEVGGGRTAGPFLPADGCVSQAWGWQMASQMAENSPAAAGVCGDSNDGGVAVRG